MPNNRPSPLVCLALLIFPFTAGLASLPNMARAAASTRAKAKPAAPAKAKLGVSAKKDDVEAANPFLPKDFPKPDIDGTVMIPTGKPVAGAHVTWITGDKDDKTALIAITDDYGKFHFDGKTAWSKSMPLGSIVVCAEGYGISGGRFNFSGDMMHPAPIDVVLPLATEAHIKLLNPKGEPAGGVIVRIDGFVNGQNFLPMTHKPDGIGMARTAADGSVSFPGLPQGCQVIIGVADNRFAQIQFPFSQQRLADARVTELMPIKLAWAGSISGTVTTPDGKPVSKAAVQARSIGNGMNVFFAQADSHGHFTIPQALPGRYNLSVSLNPPFNSDWTSHGIPCTVVAGVNKTALKIVVAKYEEPKTLNFTADPPLLPVVIHGIVIDEDGNSVPDAGITGSVFDYGDGPTVRSGPDGKFAMSVDGSSLINLRAEKGDRITVKNVIAFSGDEVTLKLQSNALATIRGVIVDADGKPIPGAAVTPTMWHSQIESRGTPTSTDSSGAYVLARLQPGYRYSLQFTANGYGSGTLDQIIPKPGEMIVADSVALKRADSFVAGHVVNSHGFPLENAHVSINGDQVKQVMTDKQGKFRIDGVAPGDVFIQVKAGDEWMDAQLTAGKDTNVIRTQSLTALQKEEDALPKPVDYVGKYAPEFSVSNWVNVSPIKLSDLKGKIIIIDMWGCCIDNLFETQQMAQQFADHGVVAIGLNVAETSLKDVQEHIAKEHLTLPIAIDKDTAKSLGDNGFECYSLVGRSGKIAYAGRDFNKLMKALAYILAEEHAGAK